MHAWRGAADVFDLLVVHFTNAVREGTGRIDDAFRFDIPLLPGELVLKRWINNITVTHIEINKKYINIYTKVTRKLCYIKGGDKSLKKMTKKFMWHIKPKNSLLEIQSILFKNI